MKQHIPNALTLANLFCGCCAILYILDRDPVTAAMFTLGSFLFDYADGMVARALGVSSPLGKELDSLADVVSFGVVPGMMIYIMLKNSVCGDTDFIPGVRISGICLAALPAFVLSAFSAFRLGRFNLDTRQTTYFLGLSTPASTVFVLGLTLTAHHDLFDLRDLIQRPLVLYSVVAILSALLVSEIPMFGMKIKGLDLKSNLINLIFLALAIVLGVYLQEFALSVLIICYIVLSIIFKNRITSSL